MSVVTLGHWLSMRAAHMFYGDGLAGGLLDALVDDAEAPACGPSVTWRMETRGRNGAGRDSRPSSSRTWYRDATSSSAMLPDCQPSGVSAVALRYLKSGSGGDTGCKQGPGAAGPAVEMTEIQSRGGSTVTTEMVSRRGGSETGGPGSQRTMRERKAGERVGRGDGRRRGRKQVGRDKDATQPGLGGLAASSEGGV